jgi:hypothetical protein
VVVVLAALCSILASCDADEPLGSTAGSEEITFPASDGVMLSGRLFGPAGGSAGVVLAHMFPSDQSAWFAFAERLGQPRQQARAGAQRGEEAADNRACADDPTPHSYPPFACVFGPSGGKPQSRDPLPGAPNLSL